MHHSGETRLDPDQCLRYPLSGSWRMAWAILIRNEHRLVRHSVEDLAAALSAASLLLQQGIVIEGIEGPEGLEISANAIYNLCRGSERPT